MSLTGAVLIALAVPGAGEDPVRDALKDFTRTYRRIRSLDGQIEAVRGLAQHRDPRVADMLTRFLTNGQPELRIATARCFASFKGVDGVGRDLAAASRHVRNRQKQARGVVVTLLQSMAAIGGDDVLREVNGRIPDRDPFIAKAAIVTAGKLRHKSSIGVLVKALMHLEGPAGKRILPEGPFGDELPPTTIAEIIRRSGATGRDGKPMATRRDLLSGPIQQALTAITRVEFSDPGDWREWWAKNARSFTVPK